MLLHFTRIAAIIVFLLLLIFLPFMPGEYDASAITLSTMAQAFGFSGLLFVPIGIAWLIYEITKQKRIEQKRHTGAYGFAIATLVISIIVAFITSLGAFVNNNFSIAIITLLIYGLLIPAIIRSLKNLKNESSNYFNPAPLYLIMIPAIVVFIRLMFIISAIDYSRSYVIKQSEQFIQDIETYYDRNGYYPASLLSLLNDYHPTIRGVKQFHYETAGKAYNIYFEQFSNKPGVREIVMYNKLGQHEMTSHDMDLLQLSLADQNRQRGYLSKLDLPQKNWKYFWFD